MTRSRRKLTDPHPTHLAHASHAIPGTHLLLAADPNTRHSHPDTHTHISGRVENGMAEERGMAG